jgi:hypothetical protein
VPIRNIPLTTLPLGPTIVGPFSINNTLSGAQLAISRTNPGGLNDLTAASVVAVSIELSPDGTTWTSTCGATWVGGIYTSRAGQLNTDTLAVGVLTPGTGQVRLVATVTGPAPVVVSGTLTTG